MRGRHGQAMNLYATGPLTPSVPVRVDYQLTVLGADLQQVVQPLKA